MKGNNQSKISKKFIISISIIYSILIIFTAVFFHIIVLNNINILQETLQENNKKVFMDKAEIIIDRLYYKGIKEKKDIIREITKHCTYEKDYLSIIIYSKTQDENFFKVEKIITTNSKMKVNLREKQAVQEKKEINYLKKGMRYGIFEEKIYSKNFLHWQNIYYPFKYKNKNLVLQFMISTNSTIDALKNYINSIRTIRTIAIIITIVLVITVIMITLVFMNNYTLFIDNLSLFMDKVAKGNLDINLNETDNELNKVALSFNSMIEEFKDKKDISLPENNLFNIGVSMIKQNKLDDSIAIFKTLTIIKPESFGNYFNLGVAYARKKDYENSLSMFEKAAKENPSHDIIQKYITRVRKLINRYGKAQ